MFLDFFPNNKNKVIIITRNNLEIKFALLLKIFEAQSKNGKSKRVFRIISLSTTISKSLSLLIKISINIKTLLL